MLRATLSLADGRLNKYLPAYYYVLLATPARTVLCYAMLSGAALPDRSLAGMRHGRSAAERGGAQMRRSGADAPIPAITYPYPCTHS